MPHKKDPSEKTVDMYAAGLAALLDYTGMLDRIGGNMGVGLNAAASSFIAMMLINIIAKDKHYGAAANLYKPFTGAMASGLAAIILNRVLGNNIQNPNLLGAIGTFAGTYGVASSEYSSS